MRCPHTAIYLRKITFQKGEDSAEATCLFCKVDQKQLWDKVSTQRHPFCTKLQLLCQHKHSRPHCSDLWPRWCLGVLETHTLIITHVIRCLYVFTDSVFSKSCLMTSYIPKEKKTWGEIQTCILRFTFLLIILRGGRDFFVSKVGLTGARRRGQTVLLHRGITSWLKLKCFVTATRPLIFTAADGPLHGL